VNSQVNTQQKRQCWRYQNTRLQTILQTIAIKTEWNWHKNRHKDQWNRIEDPDMNPHNYTHLMFDNDEKHMMEKRQPCQQMLLEKVVIHLQKLKLDPCLSPCTSINSKWMKDPKYQT
jgi:hypothetical protein